MIKFLLKGIMRDKNRSLLPGLVIALGVCLTIVLNSFMAGVFGDVVNLMANFQTGHLKVMTRAYTANMAQAPNDLALLDVDALKAQLQSDYPEVEWVSRIKFGGLIDVPDQQGETKTQGPAFAQGIDMLGVGSKEIDRLNIRTALVQGRLPQQSGELLLSDQFANKLRLKVGDEVTFIGSTMYGSMAFQNYTVAGTVTFGSSALDRGAVLMDLADVRNTLDMQDAAGELMGYFSDDQYNSSKADRIVADFNSRNSDPTDEFSPQMISLEDQNGMRDMLAQSDYMSGILIFIFLLAMSVVLWNAGLLDGLRRYSEYGVRLALGESKGHIYRTMIYEALLVGFIGTVAGTFLGLGIAFYLQEVGLDFSNMTQNISMMVPAVYKAKITTESYFIGFVPGLFSVALGHALAGIGIYKRETARLFNELEV